MTTGVPVEPLDMCISAGVAHFARPGGAVVVAAVGKEARDAFSDIAGIDGAAGGDGDRHEALARDGGEAARPQHAGVADGLDMLQRAEDVGGALEDQGAEDGGAVAHLRGDRAAALRHAVDFIGGHLETGICRRVRDDLGGEQDALPADA